MDKKITEDLSAVDLQDYYHAMKKRDKGKLLHYLMDKYGMAYTTIINKFAGDWRCLRLTSSSSTLRLMTKNYGRSRVLHQS